MDRAEYASISEGLADALDFTRTIGLASGREAQSYERGGGRGVLGEADLFTRYPCVIHREAVVDASPALVMRDYCSTTRKP
jgi:hypothetical protein